LNIFSAATCSLFYFGLHITIFFKKLDVVKIIFILNLDILF